MSHLQPTTPAGAADPHDLHEDIVYPDALPFALVHLAALGVFFTGFTRTSIVMAVVLYFVRMWGVTAGYHRYFSHRSYRTSRVGQFLLAFLAQSTAQKGVLWWAAIHRHHHLHSDTEHDIHSPRHHGFWFSHVGWIFHRTKSKPDYSTIQDLTKYPELVFLDRFQHIPAVVLALVCFAIDGWTGLFVGFFLSTVLVYHGTFTINSLAHVTGRQRYLTGDDSRNNWWLALITLGEGWHNNHHHYQSSARQGFRWWEFDPTYYILKALSWTGLIWGIREPPEAVLRGEHRVGRKAMERAADSVAHSFNPERIVEEIRKAWAQVPGVDELWASLAAAPGLEHLRAVLASAPGLDEIRASIAQSTPVEDLKHALERARVRVREWLADVHLPHLPGPEELRERVEEMFAHAASPETVAARAREILLDRIAGGLLGEPEGLQGA